MVIEFHFGPERDEFHHEKSKPAFEMTILFSHRQGTSHVHTKFFVIKFQSIKNLLTYSTHSKRRAKRKFHTLQLGNSTIISFNPEIKAIKLQLKSSIRSRRRKLKQQ